MIEPIESEPIHQNFLEAADEPGQRAAAETADEGSTIDYERIIDGVTRRLAEAAMHVHRRSGPQDYAEREEDRHHQRSDEDYGDGYDQVADMMWDDPAEALRAHAEMVRRQTIQDMMPYIAPAAHSHAMAMVTHGLEPEGQQFVHEFVQHHGIDPSLLTHPTIGDLVRSKAELHQMKKGGRAPIPSTEGVGGQSMAHLDADTRRELGGIERLYKSLGIKFDPAKILGRMK